MLIEIHMIQNHSPANLNRDDLGAPKTCLFGGVTRARISSQCLKRSIRRSEQFAAALEQDGGVRTRRLIEEIARSATESGAEIKEPHLKAVRKVFEDGGVGFKDETTSDILFFLPRSAITEMGKAVKENRADLGARFAEIIGRFVKTPDIALCGRMTEFDAKGPFDRLKGRFSVDAALAAAHAISTHAVINEVDYFTAADDVAGSDSGAGHVNEAMYNSACFYKHFSIDWEQLVTNLDGDADLAALTVKCFLQAAACATPTGKQHSYAAFNPPDGILVEIKTESAMPVNYANAFAIPVPENAPRGLIGESIARLGQYVHDIADGYGLRADRFWFSPCLRYSLTYVKRDGGNESRREEPVVGINRSMAEFGGFVASVMDMVRSGQVAETSA
ncbi:MAG: type I-E CRISPR-associated protein Cas7/Cse4/CasC [Phycisphaerales bacterium]|nr:type I-E CRISPR-associated protein Cas7/Cse4/CasC [Phycisphaerales bacterium]